MVCTVCYKKCDQIWLMLQLDKNKSLRDLSGLLFSFHLFNHVRMGEKLKLM